MSATPEDTPSQIRAWLTSIPCAAIEVEGLLAQVVVADGRDEDDLAAGPARRHRLVGPLAAGSGRKAAAQNRLPRRGQPRQSHRHIGVAGSNDDDSWHLVSCQSSVVMVVSVYVGRRKRSIRRTNGESAAAGSV